MTVDLAAIYFGIFIGVFVFTFAKALQQTRSIYRRTQSLHNAYLYLIWVEAWTNFAFAILTFLFLNGVIPPGLGVYVPTVVLWSFQTQLLPQIIANRVSLIMTNRRRATHLKRSLFLSIAIINVAVCYIWVTAHLEGATPGEVKLNIIFEKFEKSFFLVIDLALNLYFLYLVRFRLIADGLAKYWQLFNFNAGMVVISTSMDILLLGFLSLPDPYLYVQFAPLAYIVKLYIELMMANLISKVVRSSSARHQEGWYTSSKDKSNPTGYGLTSRVVVSTNKANPGMSKMGKEATVREGSDGSEIYLTTYPEPHGITRTIETTVVVDDPKQQPSQA
ncbi:hypothetical protein FALBO_12231 [Fusarium albosuccineum]|uniref:Uncharacterized protein n=1 Tax=Fusarium albosuccineum TaxID=1237068 RepID=A0A8H4L3I7_9HYPO|nr:hypothetical protein FALBO_12231 [Fusarium albosuccineum]